MMSCTRIGIWSIISDMDDGKSCTYSEAAARSMAPEDQDLTPVVQIQSDETVDIFVLKVLDLINIK
jgi:hypothetical protein